MLEPRGPWLVPAARFLLQYLPNLEMANPNEYGTYPIHAVHHLLTIEIWVAFSTQRQLHVVIDNINICRARNHMRS